MVLGIIRAMSLRSLLIACVVIGIAIAGYLFFSHRSIEQEITVAVDRLVDAYAEMVEENLKPLMTEYPGASTDSVLMELQAIAGTLQSEQSMERRLRLIVSFQTAATSLARQTVDGEHALRNDARMQAFLEATGERGNVRTLIDTYNKFAMLWNTSSFVTIGKRPKYPLLRFDGVEQTEGIIAI